jgi:Ca2+-binding RTX toxin-like protein
MNKTDGILTQNIATTAGQHYTLSFWIASDNNGLTPINHFAAEWNGQTLMALTDAPDSGYQLYTFDVVGINGNSVLEFDGYNHPDAWRLDDVTLNAVGGAAPVVFTSGADTVTLPALGGTFNTLGGDDKLVYTGGPVTIDGGTGSDTLDFSQFGSAMWVNLSSNGPEIKTQDRPDLSSGTWRSVGDVTQVENLVGTAYSDFLQGDNGANTLQGGDGNDTLTGAGGADTFVFDHLGAGSQHQHDVIVDFQPGVDRIDLAATPVNNFADLFTVGDRYMEQVGNDILIHTSVFADTSILLQNVQLVGVTQSDFLF